MKKCRIVHINDGNHNELINSGRFFAEHNPKAEEKINQLLALGYEVKHIVSQYSPSIQGTEGAYTFYISGCIFYLEKEFADGDMNDDEEFEKIFNNGKKGGHISDIFAASDFYEDKNDEDDEDDDDEYDKEDDDEEEDFLELSDLSDEELKKLLIGDDGDLDEIDFED